MLKSNLKKKNYTLPTYNTNYSDRKENKCFFFNKIFDLCFIKAKF